MMEQNIAPEVKWGEWIGGGWQMFVARWQVWVPMMLVFILALLVPVLPVYLVAFATAMSGRGEEIQTGASVLTVVVGIVGGLVVLGLVTAMLGGIYRTAFKQMRGEQISVRDLFSGFDLIPRFLMFFLACIGCAIPAYLVIVLIGALIPPLFLLLIPVLAIFGLLFSGAIFFAIPLMVEKNMGAVEALQKSFATTRSHLFMFGLFAFVVGLIGALGQCACYVGMLATYPLQFLITAVAYRDVFGVQGAQGGMTAPQSYASPSWQQGEQPSYMPPPPQFTPPQFNPPPPAPQSFNPPAPQSFNPPPPPPRPVDELLPPTSVIPPPAQSEQNFCPHCKAQLTRTARFCNYCGKPLQA